MLERMIQGERGVIGLKIIKIYIKVKCRWCCPYLTRCSTLRERGGGERERERERGRERGREGKRGGKIERGRESLFLCLFVWFLNVLINYKLYLGREREKERER